jgi:sugar lactone lactonase YvrE
MMKTYVILSVAVILTTTTGCKKDTTEEKPDTEKKWIVSTIAGDGSFNFVPTDITPGVDGTLYVTDAVNHRIHKITGGQISTYAGSDSGIANGTGTAAKFIYPYRIIQANGNLYLSDLEDSRIRKISPAAAVTTYAGTAIPFFGDGNISTALFNYDVEGITADALGNIYVSDTQNHRIRKISINGQVTTIAGSDTAGSRNGNVATARFYLPAGIAIDKQGNIYVAEPYKFHIRKITPTGEVSTFAGNGEFGHADGNAGTASFRFPNDIAIGSDGSLYVADDSYIRKISAQGVVSTIAGNNTGYADGEGAIAKFKSLSGLGIDAQDNIYVADLANYRIRKISFH